MNKPLSNRACWATAAGAVACISLSFFYPLERGRLLRSEASSSQAHARFKSGRGAVGEASAQKRIHPSMAERIRVQAERVVAATRPGREFEDRRDVVTGAADLSYRLREGEAAFSEVLGLAASIVGGVVRDSAEQTVDGATRYAIDVPEELGSAELLVRADPRTKDRLYEIVVTSPLTQHELIPSEHSNGSRLQIHLGFRQEGEPLKLSAYSMIEPVTSERFYRKLPRRVWVPLGGALLADHTGVTWKAVRMQLSEEDGKECLSQRVFPPEDRFESVMADAALLRLGGALAVY